MRTISRLLIAAPLFLLTPAAAAAQIKLAVTGGMNLASVDVSTEDTFVPDFESVTGLSLGLSATIPLSETLGFQLAGGYTQKGTIVGFSDEGARVEATLKMNYVELAALAAVRLPLSGERLSAHLLAGPAFGFEATCDMSTRASFMGTSVEVDGNCDDDDVLDRSTVDLGLAGGGGIEIGLSDALGVSLGALYTFGLLDIDQSDRDSMKHRALTVRAGLVLSIG